MIVLAGADVVLPDRMVPGASIVIDGDRIAAVEARAIGTPPGATRLNLGGCTIVPGFIDVHVHGIEGHDVLDDGGAVHEVASRLPRYGVTAFCPTSVACTPRRLETFLTAVGEQTIQTGAARVLPAHLESNFINPEFKGAQPGRCLRTWRSTSGDFTGQAIADVIATHRRQVGIVTIAPEVDAGMDLLHSLVAQGHLVSIGHSGATYEEARAAIDAGVRHATHLFNRMSPMTHRAPGIPGAVMESGQVCAELICDGFHVHPALMQIAIKAKGVDGIMAITDGTAGSGLPVGSVTRLGDEAITVTNRTAVLHDGTLAGSVLTMDGAFRMLVRHLELSLVQAARLCATTPARQLGLRDMGMVQAGAFADLVVLDEHLHVRHTLIGGAPWRNWGPEENV